jgi:hypothetical protein
MNLKQATTGRRIAAKAGAWIFLIFFMAVLDGIISQARAPLNRFDVLPGTSEKFNFTLREPVERIEDLSYQSGSEQIRVSFESIHKGFFLGGEMVRGTIMVGDGISPGAYTIHMGLKKTLPKKSLSEYTLKVYPDPEALRKNALSFFRRELKVSPWAAACGFLMLLAISLGVVYYCSIIRESLLANAGKADIYRIKKYTDFYEVAFGLGYDHGLKTGMRIHLLDKNHQVLGEAEVKNVFPSDSFAVIPLTQTVIPGYMVAIKP